LQNSRVILGLCNS